ncbi:Fcf2 pre-rRNA processing family protein [Babesia caballi]|uniref:Fcf2 pre-rRNA processing family protein n=1 Tax=Babesia caballi TaxID=5871 RepID=A0AAV4LQA6_BABCB|nr:Fcf2 pre-rRNA processing family protein [Babesia caballi]
MTDKVDPALLSYAGLFSDGLRELDTTTVGDRDAEELDIRLDLKDELESDGTRSVRQVTNKGKTKGEIRVELEKKWDPLTEREPTVQDEREWRAIQLRGFMDPKRFYKGSKSGKLEPLPQRYQVGIMTKSSGVKAGPGEESQAAGAVNSRKRRRGTSVLAETLAADQTWTRKKYREIQAEKTSGSKGWYSRQRAKLKKSAP